MKVGVKTAKSVKGVAKETVKSLTTPDLKQNILVQGLIFSVGAIGGEYADTLIGGLVAKIPIGTGVISTNQITQLTKLGLSVAGMAFVKNSLIRMGLFGVFAQSILTLIRPYLAKILPTPAITLAKDAIEPMDSVGYKLGGA